MRVNRRVNTIIAAVLATLLFGVGYTVGGGSNNGSTATGANPKALRIVAGSDWFARPRRPAAPCIGV